MQHGILCNLWFRSGKNWVDSTCEDSKGSPLSNFRTRCCHRPEPCKCQQPRKTKEKMLAAATRRRRPIFISRLLCTRVELNPNILNLKNPSDRNISLFGVQIILLQAQLFMAGLIAGKFFFKFRRDWSSKYLSLTQPFSKSNIFQFVPSLSNYITFAKILFQYRRNISS